VRTEAFIWQAMQPTVNGISVFSLCSSQNKLDQLRLGIEN